MQLTEVGVKCPKCGIKFNSRIAAVIQDTGYRDSELRCVPNDPQEKFEHFSMCTCPSCGKSDWATSFTPSQQLSNIQQQPVPAHLQYRQAAIDGERNGRSWYEIALYYLYAAWCADDTGALAQSIEYRRLAAESLRKSLRDESCPLSERQTVEYLVGEILRRGGLYGECVQHFKEVIPRLPAKFAFMARKLTRLAEIQNNAPIPFDTTGV